MRSVSRGADPDDPERWAEWRVERQHMWRLLAEALPTAALERVHTGTIGLAQLSEHAERIKRGEVAGRLVVDVAA